MNTDHQVQRIRFPTADANAPVSRSSAGRELKGIDPLVPPGFILFSEAIRRLQTSMRAGVSIPTDLRDLRDRLKQESDPWVTVDPKELKTYGPASRAATIRMSWSQYRGRKPVGFGPWREEAGQCLTKAALKGKLGVFLARQDRQNPVCNSIPSNILRRLMVARGRLPDWAIRPSLKACDGDQNLFLSLYKGCLVIEETEFNRWRDAERRKGRWPSQQRRTKPLSNAVLELVDRGVWSGRRPVAELRRLLIDQSKNVPSADTLGRLVDKLRDEKGDRRLHRKKRRPTLRRAPQ